MKNYLCNISLLLILYFNSATATTPGGQAGSFLRLGLGARAIAMGNAFTGLARDGFSGYYNPASLPFMTRPEVSLSLGNLSLYRKHNFVGFSTYLNPKSKNDSTNTKTIRAGFSLGWLNAGVENIDGRDSNGKHIGMFSNTEHVFYFSFGIRPVDFIAIGLSAKVVNSRFPKILDDDETLSASGFGMDFGIYLIPVEKLSLGAVVHDFNTKYTWNTEKLWERGTTTINKFPLRLRLGAAYQLPLNAQIAADAEFNEEQGWRIYMGGEIPYKNLLVGRMGFNANRFTFGFGVLFEIWKTRAELSYAYDTINITPSAEQYFSLRIML